MLRVLPLVPVILFLAACSSAGKGVTKCGKGVYVVSGSPDHAFGNYLNTSRKVAIERANTYCQSKGRQVLVEKVEEGLPTHVTFRCLREGDPELENSAYNPAFVNEDPCTRK